MIRINLLGSQKTKGKRAPAAVSIPGEGMGVTIKVLLVLVITAAFNFGYWFQLNREKTHIAEQMAQADAKNRELAESLTREQATSDVLRIIASSPAELQPVLDAICERAARVCGAVRKRECRPRAGSGSGKGGGR